MSYDQINIYLTKTKFYTRHFEYDAWERKQSLTGTAAVCAGQWGSSRCPDGEVRDPAEALSQPRITKSKRITPTLCE